MMRSIALIARINLFLFGVIRAAAAVVLGVCVIIVLLQDLLINPGAAASIFTGSIRDPSSLPQHVESAFIPSRDGTQLEVWHLKGVDPTKRQTPILLLHGNGVAVEGTFSNLRWFHEQGYSSYTFDYRGYGHSSGWPSEQGMYNDSEAVFDFVLNRENTEPSKVILVGISLGTGFASYLAQLHHSQTLALFAPYSSIEEVVRARPGVGFLSPFLWYALPTSSYLSRLDTTCVVLAHGKRDRTINIANSDKLENVVRGRGGRLVKLISSDAGHNDLFAKVADQFASALHECQFN